MYAFILALLVVALPAAAVEVEGIGVGVNEQFALANAKQNALEQVTGAFVVSKTTAKNDRIDKNTAKYSGGVIRKYDIVDTYPTGNMVTVVIKADVDSSKDNRIITTDNAMSEDDRQIIIENHERISNVTEFATKLDDYHQAFVAVPGRITYNVRGNTTDVNILLGVKLSPKWVDDVLTLSKEAGKRINTDTPCRMCCGELAQHLRRFT